MSIGSWYWRRKACQRGSALASANLFGPVTSCRAAASSLVSPRSGSTCSSCTAPSRESTCQGGASDVVEGALVAMPAASGLTRDCGNDVHPHRAGVLTPCRRLGVRQPADLDELQAQVLQPAEEPVQLLLIADRAAEQRLHRLGLDDEAQGVGQMLADAAADPELV